MVRGYARIASLAKREADRPTPCPFDASGPARWLWLSAESSTIASEHGIRKHMLNGYDL